MKLTIEISNISELHKLLLFFKELKLKQVFVSAPEIEKNNLITRGNKKINPRDLFGIWSKKPRTLESIRAKAWGNRNWNI